MSEILYNFIDSIEVKVFDINRCSICNDPILPEDEICELLNENMAPYKVNHFYCEFPGI